MKKEARQKTAEEYLACAEAHKQAYRNQWKTFLKSGAFVVAAFVAILVLTVAWFVNNSRVNVDGINISAENDGFELRSYGKKGLYDDDIISQFFDSVTVEGGDAQSSLTTTGTKSSVNWLMSEGSNLGNNNASETEADFSVSDRKDYAIEPGSEGRMTFYIVPGTSGTQTFQLALSVVPYSAVVESSTNKIRSVTEVGQGTGAGTDTYARQFISGHILFFLESATGDSTDLTWIQDGTFEVTIPDAVADQEYAYTIYWKWPQVFSEIVLNAGDRYLNQRELILTGELRNEIVEDMAENPQNYFYNSLTRSPLTTNNSLISSQEGIADIHTKSPAVGEGNGYNAQNFVDLSSFYNQADQIIGSRISFILVELSAESGGTKE